MKGKRCIVIIDMFHCQSSYDRHKVHKDTEKEIKTNNKSQKTLDQKHEEKKEVLDSTEELS